MCVKDRCGGEVKVRPTGRYQCDECGHVLDEEEVRQYHARLTRTNGGVK